MSDEPDNYGPLGSLFWIAGFEFLFFLLVMAGLALWRWL